MTRALAALVALLAGCTAPESANPTPRCDVEADCAASEHCYRGLCVPDVEDDAGDPPPMGADGGPSCKRDETWCTDRCVRTEDDHEHCGACNNRCGEDDRCHHGRCEEDG